MGKMWREGKQGMNPANTSILLLKNSPDFLALCQAGFPFVMNKDNLQSQGFSNFDWINSAFSAHPKVDPDNGDIFNIGTNTGSVELMKATKDMKKLCQTTIKLRNPQMMHDFCLAGDYVVFFEAPLRFSLKDLLWGNKFFINCLTFDESLSSLIHIYEKKSLEHVKTVEFESFYSFHFTNGFSTADKIVMQYVRYDCQSSKMLLKAVADYPKFVQKDYHEQYPGTSTLQELSINLKDFSTSKRVVKINGQFPVCEDHEVGKAWRYTYAVGSSSDDLLKFDTLYKYDRESEKMSKMHIEGNVNIGEPALIRTANDLYLLCVVNRDRKSYAEIYRADDLKQVCRMELPEFIPAGFHGKWESL